MKLVDALKVEPSMAVSIGELTMVARAAATQRQYDAAVNRAALDRGGDCVPYEPWWAVPCFCPCEPCSVIMNLENNNDGVKDPATCNACCACYCFLDNGTSCANAPFGGGGLCTDRAQAQALISGEEEAEEEAEILGGNVLIGVGTTTLVQLCRLMEADDLEAIGAAMGQTLEVIQTMGVEDVLGWASRCAQLASQDDADALPAPATPGNNGDAKTDVSWAQGILAVCVLLFVVGKLAAFLFTPGRPQAAEDDKGDDKGDDEEDAEVLHEDADEDADEAEAHVETEI